MNLKMEHGDHMTPAGHMGDEYYPEFTYESPEPLGLPDEGVMKIRFRKARSSERLVGDEKQHSCTIAVLAIESVKATKVEAEEDLPVKSDRSTEDALDALMKEKNGLGDY